MARDLKIDFPGDRRPVRLKSVSNHLLMPKSTWKPSASRKKNSVAECSTKKSTSKRRKKGGNGRANAKLDRYYFSISILLVETTDGVVSSVPEGVYISKPSVPVVEVLPSAVRVSEQSRSIQALEDKESLILARLARHFKEGAQVIRLPFSLETLKNSPVSMTSLETECERLEGLDEQVMSAIFVDVNGVPILAYCAHRARDVKDIPRYVSL
jgi:hypothetical protein